MGPVVGIAYGSTISDWKLVKRSLLVEAGSLAFCILMGVIIGGITGPTQLSDVWPTQEMTVRATWANFYIGLPVAFFSGLGVAVSLLDEQTSSLVGVAISASLLPPAVNAGILWIAFRFVESGVIPKQSVIVDVLNTSLTVDPSAFEDESGEVVYTRRDFSNGGLVSLLLTLANILLIWLSSMFMFRLKEVSIAREVHPHLRTSLD